MYYQSEALLFSVCFLGLVSIRKGLMRLGLTMLEYINGLNVAWNVGFVCKVSIIGIFMHCQVSVDPFPVPCIIK